MSDDRTEVKTPNLLAPEQARPIEAAPGHAEHEAVPVDATPADAAEHGVEAPVSAEVVELSQRDVAKAQPKKEKDPFTAAVEDILEDKFEAEGELGKIMEGLPAADRTKFIAESEVALAAIMAELRKPRPVFARTLDRITKWLHMLPMLNKEYLRQEAKRKNDQIIMYVEAQEQRDQLAA